MPPAEIGHRLEHRRERPRALDRSRGAGPGCASRARRRPRARCSTSAVFPTPGQAGEQHRPAVARGGVVHERGRVPRAATSRPTRSVGGKVDASAGSATSAEDLVAQLGRGRARCHAQLVPQGAVHALVLSQRRSSDRRRRRAPASARRGPASSAGSSARSASHRAARRSSSTYRWRDVFASMPPSSPRTDRRQERPAIHGEGPVRRRRRHRCRSVFGERLEFEQIDDTSSFGNRATVSCRSTIGVTVAERLPGVVRSLVQARGGVVDTEIGPDRIEALLAVETAGPVRARAA